MSETGSKGGAVRDGCPRCGARFRTGALPSAAEQRRLEKQGIVDLGFPPEVISCPRCGTRLRVVSVLRGTFFTAG